MLSETAGPISYRVCKYLVLYLNSPYLGDANIAPVKGFPNNYINASVFAYEDRKFILTQAPMQSTTEMFWAMVYQNNVRVIVKLCNCNTPELAV